jgi:hypothetical protein
MKFVDINYYDDFISEVIFWIELLEPPLEIQQQAKQFDGDNYDETCFGLKVSYDSEKKEFSVVTRQEEEMDRDTEDNLYYIDNIGDEHWYKAEIPEDCKRQIFAECQKIIDSFEELAKETDATKELKETQGTKKQPKERNDHER